MAETKTQSLAELQAENAALKAELARLDAQRIRPRAPLPKDTGDFVSTRPHYRAGRYYQAGEIISIVDESPGRTWTKVVKGQPIPEVKSPQGPTLRPSDRSIT